MNCNCIKDLEAKVKDFVQPKVKAPIDSVKCQAVAFVLGKSLHTALSIPFAIKADAPGYRSAEGKVMPVHASYCPFCGVSTKPKQEAKDE